MNRIACRPSGFSLIEVLVSVVVMSFGLLSLAALQSALFKAGAESRSQSAALALATEKIEFFEGYRDRDEFQSYTDGSDVAVTIDGVAYTRSWTVDRFAFPEAGGSFAAVADTGDTATNYVDNNEFKRIQVNVAWTDAMGADQQVSLETAIAALSPQDTAKLAKVGSTGGPRGPQVIIVNPASEEGVIPIAVGDGTDTAATNPKPEVAGKNNAQRVIETRFDVLTYAALTGDTALAQSRVETVIAGCTCSTANKPASTARGKRPTYWNGLRYVVPEDAEFAPPAGVATAVENQSSQCTICCRDHHDPDGVDGAKFDPRRSDHAHQYFNMATGQLQAIGANGQYTEACRLIRVDGIFRVAADMYNDYMNLLETDNDPATTLSDYVPSETATDVYQKFVLDYLDTKFVAGSTSGYNTVLPPNGTVVASIIADDGVDDGDDLNEPHSPLPIDRADDGTSTLKWLHARGLYIDYLEDEALQAVNDAKLDCPEGVDERTCVLKVLPFTTINITELADWSTEDTTQIVASNNDFRLTLQSEVPIRGKVVPGTKPTHAHETDAIAKMRLSNSGLAVLKGPIDTSDTETDSSDDASIQSDSQAFLPDAKWDCTTDYCTGVNAGGTFQIGLDSYTFTNAYPTFLIAPTATCNPATTGNTRPNPFTCTSQKMGVAQSVTVGNYNYQIHTDVNQDVTCTGDFGAKTRKLKYTAKTCRNYSVSGASLWRAGSQVEIVNPATFVVENDSAMRETTNIDFAVVEAGDEMRISFDPLFNDTTRTPVCTYEDDGSHQNDYHVEVPDCPTVLP